MQGLLSHGEPMLKRPKFKIYAPENAHIWLSLQEWLLLIFGPYLSLVELVQMKRVCKSFATHAGLEDLISLKIYSAFDGIPERHWNRMTVMVNEPLLDWDGRWTCALIELEFFRKHIGKFMVVVDNQEQKIGRFRMAVFSSFSKLEKFVNDTFLTNDRITRGRFVNDGALFNDDTVDLFRSKSRYFSGGIFMFHIFGQRFPLQFFDTLGIGIPDGH
jgi:hypothetical protein